VQTIWVSSLISRHGSLPSSSAKRSSKRVPVCCSIQASSASLGMTRSAPLPAQVSSTDGARPLLTTSLMGTKAMGARMRLLAPKRPGATCPGGRCTSG
jgi:hypothetical protein